jgi:hypothetical protein
MGATLENPKLSARFSRAFFIIFITGTFFAQEFV